MLQGITDEYFDPANFRSTLDLSSKHNFGPTFFVEKMGYQDGLE